MANTSTSVKPVPLLLLPENIPQELRVIPQWVTWQYQWLNGRWTKPPYCALSGKLAKTTDPATWSDYPTALARYKNAKSDGIGIVLTEGLGIVGIDLDNCRDPESGMIQLWAEKIIKETASYTEVSPSGTGIRILAYGTKSSEKCRKGDVEVYATGRYLTLTGHHLPGTPTTLEERTEAIGRICVGLLGDQANPTPSSNGMHEGPAATDSAGLTDEQILTKARTARNGSKFSRLFSGDTGDHDGDESRADQSLCNMLAFWTQDAQQIDRLFRQSGLYRAKWDELHGQHTYGHRTIQQALQLQQEHYRHKGGASASANGQSKETCLHSRRRVGPGRRSGKDLRF